MGGMIYKLRLEGEYRSVRGEISSNTSSSATSPT